MSTRVADGRFEFVDSQQILNRNSRDMQFTILSEMQVAVCTQCQMVKRVEFHIQELKLLRFLAYRSRKCWYGLVVTPSSYKSLPYSGQLRDHFILMRES